MAGTRRHREHGEEFRRKDTLYRKPSVGMEFDVDVFANSRIDLDLSAKRNPSWPRIAPWRH